jgi:hypothetical protein
MLHLPCAGMVQIALAKESVLWKRGLYTFPRVRCSALPVHFQGLHFRCPIMAKPATHLWPTKCGLPPSRTDVKFLA